MDYIIPFHGAVGVLASPGSRTFLSSQACFTSNLNNLSVPITLPSSSLSAFYNNINIYKYTSLMLIILSNIIYLGFLQQ